MEGGILLYPSGNLDEWMKKLINLKEMSDPYSEAL